MPFDRMSGILLHPTSLPGPFGIGDLGPGAYQFIDFLVASGQRLWQILPLGPTGYGNSPYMCFSAIAGNPLLISPELLVRDGLLEPADWEGLEEWSQIQAQFAGSVDYPTVIHFKRNLLRKAAQRFWTTATDAQRAEFKQFCHEEADWLDDYALFMALLRAHEGKTWADWPDVPGGSITRRDPKALQYCQQAYADDIDFYKFVEFTFLRQWDALKTYATARDVAIVGDIPIYVAYNSADVWANREMFCVDAEGQLQEVAGVPPDYFSTTGQLWGNPIYRWDVLQKTGYRWWMGRFRQLLRLVDIVRIDHFRAFEAYWSVPGDATTAMDGEWIEGPGADFFQAIRDRLGQLPILAEDLGLITPEVEALRDQFDFPGMRVLQFAFGDNANNPYLPHNYVRNCAVYTGTHDNDTMVGWFYGDDMPSDRGYGINPHERDSVLRYLGCQSAEGIHWDFIRLALSSIADLAIIPLQDVLGLSRDSRMNFPATAEGNWRWRYTGDMLSDEVVLRLADMSLIYRRIDSERHHERLQQQSSNTP
jgi:4-alpha-glucanotransferase